MSLRRIVRIDQEKCTGCGACVSPCAEGAIRIIDGKARVVREELCDGAGLCVGTCPEGAISIEVREAPAFDRQAAEKKRRSHPRNHLPQRCFRCGTDEDQAHLLPVRHRGEDLWVCVRCLPPPIHG